MRTTLYITALAALGTLPAQAQTSPELSALRACAALAEAGKGSDAKEPGQLAASLYRKRIEQNPRDVDALVGAARTLSQCLTPSASFMERGELSSEAMDLLDRALEIQPDHWLARYVLASIAFRSPAFLGRGKRAAKELDVLLQQQGDRTDNPMFARVFAMRGMQLSRSGQADSARALWKRGAALFPNDAELQRLGGVPAETKGTPANSAPPAALAPVQVTASSAPPRLPLPSIREVTRSQVLLTAGGTADVMQSVQMQPGATRVGEGGDVYTRGGDASETSLIVNGGRILSLARFEGLSGSMFGAIEPFVVKSVRYSSGGFSARHGNALSGVLVIETDGRPVERQTRAGVSLVHASGTVRAPFGARAGGWISGRVSHTGVLLETHGRAHEYSGSPHSQEMIGSFVAAPTAFTEVRATALVERDDSRRVLSAAGWHGPFLARGDTRALTVSSRWMSSRRPVAIRATVSGSSRGNDWAFGVLARDRDERSQLARVDAEWQVRAPLTLRTGVEQGTHTRRDAGTVPTTASVALSAPLRHLGVQKSAANQIGAYVEAEASAGALWVTAGARADRLPGEEMVTVDPRLALSARLGAWTARVSTGVFRQGRWRGDAAIPDGGTPSGLALTSRHLVAGLEHETASRLLRAEAFAKGYSDYRAWGAGPAIARSDARGVDVIAQQTSGPLTGFLGYSWLSATSRLATGETVRGSFDVTHSLTASLTRTLGDDWSVGSTLRYGTGAPRTQIVRGTTAGDGRPEPIYGPLMSERLPAYARLDTRVMRYVRLSNMLLTAYAEVLNVGGRANVSGYAYDASYATREPVHTFFASRTFVLGGELMFR